MRNDLITATRPIRPPQDKIPQTRKQRERLLGIISEYVKREKPVAPLSLGELQRHSDNVIKMAGVKPKFKDFIAILVNNDVWRETVASIP